MTGTDMLPTGMFFCLCFSKNLLHQSCHSDTSASDSYHIGMLVLNGGGTPLNALTNANVDMLCVF